MNGRYILDGHMPVPCDELLHWAKAMETDRHVGNDTIGDAQVSTVFLGLDHSFHGGPPILFETMVFGSEFGKWERRYCTWEEAEAGHREIVAAIKAGTAPSEEPA